MKFGLMTQIQVPRPWGPGVERDAFHNAVAQAAAGEALGFEYFWITEQHFYYARPTAAARLGREIPQSALYRRC
jgi:alkanesulfonate monooxygenase SsuD/methylene tetrahydromethanopterin reductase-like flavin-dependent oxidoreductase (luciferase family)